MGETKHVNQEIEAYVAIYCSTHPETWAKMLPTLEFTHNNCRHADWTRTPFELMYSISSLAIPLTFESTMFPSVEECLNPLSQSQQKALAAHKLAWVHMADRFKQNFRPFCKEQMVWLDAKNLKTPYLSKFAPKQEGPFKIKDVLGPLTYRLELPKQWEIYNVFYASLLLPFNAINVYGPSFTNPPPDLINGEDEYKVESILKHQKWDQGY